SKSCASTFASPPMRPPPSARSACCTRGKPPRMPRSPHWSRRSRRWGSRRNSLGRKRTRSATSSRPRGKSRPCNPFLAAAPVPVERYLLRVPPHRELPPEPHHPRPRTPHDPLRTCVLTPPGVHWHCPRRQLARLARPHRRRPLRGESRPPHLEPHR